ncbi:MAG: hypothetical protein IPQ19_14825 [Bacteroidetes bacterium]|nr:hypothetical protein [Bacteroidota bacterium]
MDIIIYKNEIYTIIQVDLPKIGHVFISPISLNNALMDEKSANTSNEAIKIDEEIYFFVEENEIYLKEEELINLLHHEVL